MDLEEKFGIRSTFFFRTIYENGDYLDYEDDIKSLQKCGWEIGLHTDPSSVADTGRIRAEKARLETLTKNAVRANRVHYMKFDPGLPGRLEELGFVYDSSTKQFREAVTAPEDMNYRLIGNLVEFPITLMDAYMFTYMKVPEEKVLQTFAGMLAAGRSLLSSANAEFSVMSVLWHDNVIRMKGGRMYSQVLEYLASQDDVRIMRGIDLAEMIVQRQQQEQKEQQRQL
jgi:peptidoglycan/xylan/chitin deacetylase (PgdA/CDA1 family)